jgi:hypothetical protein
VVRGLDGYTTEVDGMTGRGTQPSGAWHALPVALLRHAGFPLALLDGLRTRDLAPIVDRVLAADQAVAAATAQLESGLAAVVPNPEARATIKTRLGQSRSLPARYIRILSRDPETRAATARWEQEARRREGAWQQLRGGLAAHLDVARRETIEAFRRDQTLQQVLLLSNDAQYSRFRIWIEQGVDRRPAKVRALVDTLVGYLQRVCTKNETHSHFGPFTPARLTDGTGISWHRGVGPVRSAFLSYWSAREIARLASQDPVLRDYTRPRRHPLAMRTNNHVDLYRIETADPADFEAWPFSRQQGRQIDRSEAWLLERCDSTTTVRDLRARWQRAGVAARGDGNGFDPVLTGLERDGFVIVEFEIPSGTCSALADLRAILRDTAGAAAPYVDLLDELDELLVRFADASGERRADLLERIKRRFTEFTGVAPNRGAGQMYADRSVLFEECRTSLRDVRIGRDVTDFLTDELSLACDLLLIVPRQRIRREADILHQWCIDRYGRGVQVPLAALYKGYFDDQHQLAAACEEVELELHAVARQIESTLLGYRGSDVRQGSVDRSELQTLIGRFPAWPGAVLNPDVMLIASDERALRQGDFQAVVGDCHALRELLTHCSVAPLLLAEHPDLGALAVAGYHRIVEDDELLVDVVREHLDKTFVQLPLGIPDLEVAGASGQPRAEVLTPHQLCVDVGSERLELRAVGHRERLRLLSPPAGGPSIATDPLSVFAFPRHLDGTGLTFPGHLHVPRITCGRVVLTRERWRVSAERLVPEGQAFDDAAAFLAAQILRRELSLPDRVFAKVASEPKPLYVDWDAPLLVRQLAKRARSGGDEIELTEMLPGPDHLWFDVDGRRYTSELRVALFSSPANPPPRDTRPHGSNR